MDGISRLNGPDSWFCIRDETAASYRRHHRDPRPSRLSENTICQTPSRRAPVTPGPLTSTQLWALTTRCNAWKRAWHGKLCRACPTRHCCCCCTPGRRPTPSTLLTPLETTTTTLTYSLPCLASTSTGAQLLCLLQQPTTALLVKALLTDHVQRRSVPDALGPFLARPPAGRRLL